MNIVSMLVKNLMMNAPSAVSEKQLKELNIKLVKKD